MGITDLEEQFTFYASYHHSTINKLIHIACVWPLLWTAFVMSEFIPIELPIPFLGAFHPPNVTLLAALFYAAVYVAMDREAGTVGAILVLISLITARRFYLTSESAFVVAFGVHVLCWVVQFIGHGKFEGRAPALLDNLMQAFVMAPLFVLLEVFFFFGYRKGFQQKMWARVEVEIKKFRAEGGKKK